MRSASVLIGLLLMTFWAWVFPAWPGGDPKMTGSAQRESSASLDEKNREYFTDLKVITQEGKELRFYSDILKDKLVVISFFYINCPTAQIALVTFFKLQKMLGDRLGKDVLLLTVSVDPEKDTPPAVRDFAKKYNPREGWLFLTGKEEDMEVINRRLGNTGRLPEGHARVFLLGNLKSGHWMRIAEDAHEFSLDQGLRSLSGEDS